jgi:hypothetical protein
MSAQALPGGCLCGAVRFAATPVKMEMHACHCGSCRRWSGGPLQAVMCGDAVTLENDAALGVYPSSDWGERCFCKVCGTVLFWRLKDGSHVAVSAQAFDDPAAFAFSEEIFVDRQPDNYAFANKTHRLTGDEVFARFAAGQG